jgi:hypothetical protein
MYKLRNMLVGAIAIVALSTSAYAGTIGLGVMGSYAAITATGTESDSNGDADTSGRSAAAANDVLVGSVFAEYTLDSYGGLTLGFDYVPFEARVSDKAFSRTDANNNADATDDNVTRSANALISNIYTYYAEIPLASGIYAKAGITEMDVQTTEVTDDGVSHYGDVNVDGLLIGMGYKTELTSNTYLKLEGTHTQFDSLKLASNITDKGNTITADLDVTKLSIGLGMKF